MPRGSENGPTPTAPILRTTPAASEADMGQGREGPAPFLTVQALGGVLPAQAVRDLPADAYPFVIEFLNQDRKVVHRIDVPGPGGVAIPGLAAEHGPISVRLTFANGEVQEDGPPSAPRQ